LLFTGLCQRGFSDNEGMYAEIGREMLVSGDWVTPHLNGSVYLNKPPLLFWLVALVLRVTGPNELGRLISGLAALATMLLVYDLGRRLWPDRPAAGVWAAAVYLSCVLTPIEARILRPDSLLTFLITLTMWGLVRVNSRSEARDGPGVAAIWSGIGLAMMDKGLLGLLLPALVFLPALLLGRQWKEARRCFPLWGLGVAAIIVLPWHLAAGAVNPGFWWDYVVNQHLLYFFDRKFPRDSIPQPLGFVWAAFAGRLAPWVLLLPAAVACQLRQARAESSVAAWLPLTWFGMIWLFFSASKGRIEHYFLPAVPAAALLVGRLCDAWASRWSGYPPDGGGCPRSVGDASKRSAGPSFWALTDHRAVWTALPFLILCLTATGGLLAVPGLAHTYGLQETAPELLWIARAAFGVVAAGSLTATLMALARRLDLALGTQVATFLLFGALACRGLEATDSLTSARRLIAGIDPVMLSHSTVAYDASPEYQLCGGLNFYLRRRLLLLEPAGFVPPTYLRQDMERLFIKPDRFWNKWRQGKRRFLLFSEPTQPRDSTTDYPAPCYEVGRSRGRLLVTNLPLPKKLVSGPWKVAKRIARPE
jgi:4-amino-4-deoxy-L-arabinose transferase-like glycosyltransferase